MAPDDFTNDKNTMLRVISGYIFTLKIMLPINDNI